MKRTFALLATLCLALAAYSSAGEKKDKQAEGLALIERARELSDIRAPGSPPFRLRARVRLFQEKHAMEGTYLLVWISPSQWREQVDLPGFTQLRIGGEGTYSVHREPPGLPWPVFQLLHTLGYKARLTVRPTERVEEIKNRNKDGARLSCVKLVSGSIWVVPRELCFDSGSNTLSRIEYSNRKYEFKKQSPWGDKVFPQSLSYFEGGKHVVAIDVEEFANIESSDPSGFLPLVNAASWEQCEDAERPIFLRASGPLPTAGAEFLGPVHMVTVYGTIETSGELRNRSIISSGGKIADQWALDFLERARFQPRMCNGRPIGSEVFVYVVVSQATRTGASVASIVVIDTAIAWP